MNACSAIQIRIVVAKRPSLAMNGRAATQPRQVLPMAVAERRLRNEKTIDLIRERRQEEEHQALMR
jgi:hypothetical protein